MKITKLSEINLLDVGNTILCAGGIWNGNGKSYLVPFPNDELSENIELLALTMEDWEKFLQQGDVADTLVQTKEGKAIFRKSQRQIDSNIMWRRFEMDAYTCRYCGKTGVPLTVDHGKLVARQH